MRVFVAGATGAIGRRPVPQLVDRGHRVTATLLVNVGRAMRNLGLTIEHREVNGQPGALVRMSDGALVNVFALDITGGVVSTVRSVVNPDKLRHLGPRANLDRLVDTRRSR